MRILRLATLLLSALLSGNAFAALSDYNPTVLYFADATTDLDEPTGTTKSNPGSLTDPTVTGSPDAYIDCGGTNGVTFAAGSPLFEVGTGDLTIAMKARTASFVANQVYWDSFDGTGTTTTATGLRIKVIAGGSRRIALTAPPGSETTSTGFILETATNTLIASQDFIVAFRRSGGTWTLWVDADATGGMVTETPTTNTIGNAAITEKGNEVFCSLANGTNAITSRIYWLIAIPDDVTDTDIQLATWADEAALKALWLSAPPAGNLLLRRRRAANDDHFEQQPLRAVGF